MDLDDLDLDDNKQSNTQEICCIIIQSITDSSDNNKTEIINKNKTDTTAADKNNQDEKYLSNDRLYGWFVDIEKQNSIITK